MANKESNFVSAVIYAHNCESTIETFLTTINDYLKNKFINAEIICVNDDSKDDTVEIIKNVSKNDNFCNVSIVNMSYFHGLEIAMNAGIDLSIGDFIFEFDSTILDYDNEIIDNVYNKCLEGYDIVSSVPDKKERFSSSFFYKIFNRFTSYLQKMHTERFRILSRRVINRLTTMSKTMPYRKALYASSGLKSTYLKYKSLSNTVTPQDKVEKKYRRQLALNSIILFTDFGYKFAAWVSGVMMVFSIAMIAYSLIVFITAKAVEGWTTTILFLSITFFAFFVMLTVIIKYLQMVVELVFRRKHYSFESVEKISNIKD